MNTKRDRRIHRSTLIVVGIALVVGIVALTFSYTHAWEKRMESIEASSSADVFEKYETETIYGETFTRENVTGHKVVMYNVWETTCPACLGEMGDLEELSKSYPEDEFMIVGICNDLHSKEGELKQEQVEKAQNLMNDSGTTFPHIIPTTEMRNFFKGIIPGYPTTFFVDSDGKILEYCCGSRSLEDWKAKVDEVLKKAK